MRRTKLSRMPLSGWGWVLTPHGSGLSFCKFTCVRRGAAQTQPGSRDVAIPARQAKRRDGDGGNNIKEKSNDYFWGAFDCQLQTPSGHLRGRNPNRLMYVMSKQKNINIGVTKLIHHFQQFFVLAIGPCGSPSLWSSAR